MAILTKANDGIAVEIRPANGLNFTIEELSHIVGPNLDVIGLTNHAAIYYDTKAQVNNKPENVIARAVLYKYRDDHRLKLTKLYGDVLVAPYTTNSIDVKL